jgi:hypothetical protein
VTGDEVRAARRCGDGGAVSAEASDDEVIAVGILSWRRGMVLRCLWSIVACQTQALRAARRCSSDLGNVLGYGRGVLFQPL